MTTYVISASIYVDDVDSPEQATDVVRVFNAGSGRLVTERIVIVLPNPDDPGSSKWEESGTDDLT